MASRPFLTRPQPQPCPQGLCRLLCPLISTWSVLSVLRAPFLLSSSWAQGSDLGPLPCLPQLVSSAPGGKEQHSFTPGAQRKLTHLIWRLAIHRGRGCRPGKDKVKSVQKRELRKGMSISTEPQMTCKQGSPGLDTGQEDGHSPYLRSAKPSC